MPQGYYRFPTIHEDKVVFVCEDDLWTVSSEGGVARRLTSGLAEASYPVLSPDGAQLAFTGREEGQPEVYLMPAEGGPTQRLTFLGSTLCRTVNWSPTGQIVFASNAGHPFPRVLNLFSLDLEAPGPEHWDIGPAAAVSYGKDGGVVIGRNTRAPAQWKRYRGGTAGQIWIDDKGDGDYRPLIEMNGNLASPMWIAGRIYFLSDHEGVANIYSCSPDGHGIQRHTDHGDYYARNAASDSRRIVYHAGADLYVYDPETDSSEKIDITFHSPQTQRNRKFVTPGLYLDSWKAHPKGHSVAISTRGKAFSFANWEGAVIQHGEASGPRYRMLDWLNDGDRLIALSDQGGEENFVIIQTDQSEEPVLVGGIRHRPSH